MSNRGVVRRVSPDRTTITIALPRGGRLTCRNEGFEIGEEVCFVLDPARRHVIKVMPRDVAEARSMIAADPILQHAIMEPPTLQFEEDYDGNANDNHEQHYRQIVEASPHHRSDEIGGVIERREDIPDHSHQDNDGVRLDDNRTDETECR